MWIRTQDKMGLVKVDSIWAAAKGMGGIVRGFQAGDAAEYTLGEYASKEKTLAALSAIEGHLDDPYLCHGVFQMPQESKEEEDKDIEVVPNGPEVPLAVDRMVTRFHLEVNNHEQTMRP